MIAREKDERSIKVQECVVNLLKTKRNNMIKEERETHSEKTRRSFIMAGASPDIFWMYAFRGEI
jgi:hypothetical protein